MFNRKLLLQHIVNRPLSIEEQIESSQDFRVKKIENGKSYQFENGGFVNVTEHDDDHHVIDVNHDHQSSIRSVIDTHLSKGTPTSIQINPEHRELLKNALMSTGKYYNYNNNRKRFEYKPKERRWEDQSIVWP